MKLFFSISLLVTISLNLLITVGFLTKYIIQLDYYTNVLCENKNVANNQCQGLCHLSSELSYQNIETEQEQTTSFNYNFAPLYLQHVAPSSIYTCDLQVNFSSLESRVLVMHPKDIDHPPQAV